MFNKDEELDDKQHLDGLIKICAKDRREMMEEEIRELFEEGFESEIDLVIAADLVFSLDLNFTRLSKERKKMNRKRRMKWSLSRRFIEPCCQKMKDVLGEENNKVKKRNCGIEENCYRKLNKVMDTNHAIEPCCQKMKDVLREEKNKVKDMNYQIDLFAKRIDISKEQLVEILRKK